MRLHPCRAVLPQSLHPSAYPVLGRQHRQHSHRCVLAAIALPQVFYERIRPFLSGTKGGQALPNGVFFKGYGPNEGTRFCLFGGTQVHAHARSMDH